MPDFDPRQRFPLLFIDSLIDQTSLGQILDDLQRTAPIDEGTSNLGGLFLQLLRDRLRDRIPQVEQTIIDRVYPSLAKIGDRTAFAETPQGATIIARSITPRGGVLLTFRCPDEVVREWEWLG